LSEDSIVGVSFLSLAPWLAVQAKKILPSTLYLILESYLKDRFLRVRQGGELSSHVPVEASVPQGSVLGPFLYNVYAADIPTHPNTLLATFTDDTCILASDPDPNTNPSRPSLQYPELVLAMACQGEWSQECPHDLHAPSSALPSCPL
jgi:hypothetical protein